jgi:hypothetical protein
MRRSYQRRDDIAEEFASKHKLSPEIKSDLRQTLDNVYPPVVYWTASIVLGCAALALLVAYMVSMFKTLTVPDGLNAIGMLAFGAFASVIGYEVANRGS